MNFSVGYQLAGPEEQPFSTIVEEFREHIAEVYFPWLGMPSGRSPIGGRHGQIDPEARATFEADLATIRGHGRWPEPALQRQLLRRRGDGQGVGATGH